VCGVEEEKRHVSVFAREYAARRREREDGMMMASGDGIRGIGTWQVVAELIGSECPVLHHGKTGCPAA